jgi:serine/threonine-protein kinase
VNKRGSRPSAKNQFVVRRIKPTRGPTHHFLDGGKHDPTIPEDTGFEEDSARTVVRTPAPTLPPDNSQKFAAQTSGKESFVAAPGKTVGKYTLGEKIAQGTFGVVFAAKDKHLDREVALKLLNPAHVTNKDIVMRFLQEARAAARIAHPGIVTMFDCGTIEQSMSVGAYIAMELLHGENLTARVQRRGKLAPAIAIEIARQVACALDAAHKVDVLHRDLKSDNIYLVPDPAVPGGERVKVLDFGLAKLGNGGQTQMNTVFGTPRYMSPEQCRSATQIDHRSDIYSLGCVLFELVTGRTPFEGSLRELVDRHQRAPIPRASSFSMEVTPALDDLILQMLQKDPAMRPQTMAAVQRMLKSVAPDTLPVAAQMVAFPTPRSGANVLPTLPPETPVTAGSWPRLRKTPIIAAAIAFVIAGALTAVAARGPAKATAASSVPTASTR